MSAQQARKLAELVKQGWTVVPATGYGAVVLVSAPGSFGRPTHRVLSDGAVVALPRGG